MVISTLPIVRQVSDSADKFGSSDPDTMDQMLDLESGTIHEWNKEAPGMWRFPTNPNLCCIYRVPNSMRQMSPEAYTPQLILIGPLHHSLKSQALKARGNIRRTKFMGYLNMEEHKKIYVEKFSERLEGQKTIEGFRTMIEEDEDLIRASYSESTAWIESQEFVEMILHDSVFILELILRFFGTGAEKIGDHLMDSPCLEKTIKRDLIMLENQLPYFILEKLFDPVVKILNPNKTLRQLVINYVLNMDKTKIGDDTKFRHFTDLVRCVRVESADEETFPDYGHEDFQPMYIMHNAHKLDKGGVKIKALEEEFPVRVKFDRKNGCLEIPPFKADDDVEIIIRNIMALEQCHYPFDAHVCSYIMFLDFLIDTEKDVELLVEKEIITNWLGHHEAVAKMVNKLCLGVPEDGAYYSETAKQVIRHYNGKYNNSRAILKRVYCSDMWSGTATVAATLLLLMTLIQTVTSIIDVWPKK
ncbi:unnamed protein product [Microthlaspi erraticum]|uniref:Uncharacterized protein n=1 Tax=Microthlaspi erraticum TaxID=1685480 RepID=A0A6D2IVE9_9BRAS|nr:unnamed protein product [Microthlaspi erraticum]